MIKVAILNKAEKFLATLDKNQKSRIDDKIHDLKSCIETNNTIPFNDMPIKSCWVNGKVS